MKPRTGLLVLCLAVCAAAPALAHANTYCVPKHVTGCTQAEQTVQKALNAAAAHPGPDALKIAAGTFTGTASNCSTEAFNYSQSAPNSLTITGAGVTKTVLKCVTGGVNADVMQLYGPVTVSALAIQIPGGKAMTGLMLEGGARANGVEVDGSSDSSGDTGVVARPGTVENTTVILPTNETNNGVYLEEGSTAANVSVAAGEDAITAYLGARISRAQLTSPVGVWAEKGTTTVYDTLIDVLPTGSAYNSGLLAQDNGIGDTGVHVDVVARNVTIVGTGAGPNGVYSNAAQAGQTTDVTLTDSIIYGPLTALARTAIGGATANVTTTYDDYPLGSYAGTGAGTTTQTAPLLHANPGFLNPAMGEFELSAGSPLIDAGTPGGLTAGEPKTDLGGNPRILAGKGTCSARRDIGAYEFAPNKLPAQATASKSQTRVGRSISFHATGCSIDPSLHVTFRWKFDDGATATGATVSHEFKRAGKHIATVTVSDRVGRRGSATATVTVLPRKS